MTDHHDSTLWAVSLVGLAAWVLVSRRPLAFTWASAAGLVLLLAIHYNDRRIAWIELAGGLGLTFLAIQGHRGLRFRINRVVLLVLPLALLYTVAGWNRSERIFGPVRQLKSVLTDTEDASNDARKIENRGLVVTLQEHKLLGTGFGHPFTEVSVLYSRGMEAFFPNYRYLPHNSLVGLLAFTGIVGFSLIWTVAPLASFLALTAFYAAHDARERALGLAAFAVPFIYSVQAFGDMGVQSLTANALLAASAAVAARIVVTSGAWTPARRRSRGLEAALAFEAPLAAAPAAREGGTA